MKKYLFYIFLACFIWLIGMDRGYADESVNTFIPTFLDSKVYGSDYYLKSSNNYMGVPYEIKCTYKNVDNNSLVPIYRTLEINNEVSNLDFVIIDYLGESKDVLMATGVHYGNKEYHLQNQSGESIGRKTTYEFDYICPKSFRYIVKKDFWDYLKRYSINSGFYYSTKSNGDNSWKSEETFVLSNVEISNSKYIKTLPSIRGEHDNACKTIDSKYKYSTYWVQKEGGHTLSLAILVCDTNGSNCVSTNSGILKLSNHEFGSSAFRDRLFSGNCPSGANYDPETHVITFSNEYQPDYDGLVKGEFYEEEFDCNSLSTILPWLKGIFTTMKLSAPVLVIILGIVDFFTALGASTDDAMKKMWTKFVKRLVIGAFVLIVPYLIELILNIAGYGETICGIH